MSESVLIVGTGPGLSTSLARLCSSKGLKVALASRNVDKLNDLKKEIKAEITRDDLIKNTKNHLSNYLVNPGIASKKFAEMLRSSN